MTFPTLYKRTVTGAVQIWCIEVEGNRFRTQTGQIDGAKTWSGWTECWAKNVGKSNATTDEQQAVVEAESRVKNKLAQGGYWERIEDIDKTRFFKPMLAHKYQDRVPTAEDYAEGRIYSQPKLDGVRCIVTVDGMWTRQGKPILSAPHIREALQDLFDADPDLILDGEIYTDALKDDFNAIISMAKKSKPKPEDLAKSREHLEYWVYDLPSHPGGFADRFAELDRLLGKYPVGPWICLVHTERVRDSEHLNELYAEYLASGQEGQMVRHGDGEYENKRSKFLLKRKEFEDAEFEIVSINEGKGNWSGYAKSVTLRKGDELFSAGIKGNQDFNRELLARANELVGKQATVRYQHLTPDGVPRFGVVYVFHETERW